MLSHDRNALNHRMRTALQDAAPTLPYYLADAVYDADESKTWTVFAFNPDTTTAHTISSNTVWKQEGISTLQIMQPKDIEIAGDELDAWDIADLATSAFKNWRSEDRKTEVYQFAQQRIPNDRYLQVNVLIFWRSKRSD